MTTPDLINGAFEFGMGALQWLNVKALLRDKVIKGVSWPIWIFITAWGFFNLYFYPHLGQWVSFLGGILLVIANLSWLSIAAYYAWRNR